MIMSLSELRSGGVEHDRAIALQESCRDRIELIPANIPGTITAVDIAYSKTNPDECVTAAVNVTIQDMSIVEKSVVRGRATFPYEPGLLGFRETPLAVEAIDGLGRVPEILMVDGHGIAHPRRFGAASQLGLVLGLPAIGCAKALFFGTMVDEVPPEQFGMSEIVDPENRDVLGVAIRLVAGVKPVFVSPGHLVDVASSIEIIKACAGSYRLPEPARLAHTAAVDNLKKLI
jgi:deoxyribonuclease V